MTGGSNDFYKRKSMKTAYAGFIIKSGDSAMQKNNSVKIRLAEERDFEALHRHDKHISQEMLKKKISGKNILIAETNGEFAGWLRYNFFWDEIPFMNMLFVPEKLRGAGIGSGLVKKWESLMFSEGYKMLLTSTQSNEYSQHFYRKLGYNDLGGFFPFGEEYEIILGKDLKGDKT